MSFLATVSDTVWSGVASLASRPSMAGRPCTERLARLLRTKHKEKKEILLMNTKNQENEKDNTKGTSQKENKDGTFIHVKQTCCKTYRSISYYGSSSSQ